MRRILLFLTLLTLKVLTVSSQDLAYPNVPVYTAKTNEGLVSTAEYNSGFGFGNTSVPYSRRFSGFTVLIGYKIDRSFIISGGAGLSVYNDGALIPLFVDLRYTFYISRLAPYLYSDGGFLMNFSRFDDLKIFMNPGMGVRYSITQKIAVNLSTGIMVQSGASAQSETSAQNAFLSLKTGVTYKF